MKNLPVYLVILLMPLSCMSQSFSPGLNLGMSLTGREQQNSQNVSQQMKVSIAGSLRFSADIKGWQRAFP